MSAASKKIRKDFFELVNHCVVGGGIINSNTEKLFTYVSIQFLLFRRSSNLVFDTVFSQDLGYTFSHV